MTRHLTSNVRRDAVPEKTKKEDVNITHAHAPYAKCQMPDLIPINVCILFRISLAMPYHARPHVLLTANSRFNDEGGSEK